MNEGLILLLLTMAPGHLPLAPTHPTAAEYRACNGQATVRVTTSPSPAPSSTPGGAPLVPSVSPPVASPPGPPGAGPPYSDAELLEQADPRYRDNPVFRKVFLDCLARLGY
jgi:hypothetical protein